MCNGRRGREEELLDVQEPDELGQEEEEYDGGRLDEDGYLQDRITEEYSQHRKSQRKSGKLKKKKERDR